MGPEKQINLLKFGILEIGVVLLLAFLAGIIVVFGFNYADPKFDAWGNISLRIVFSAVNVCVVVFLISMVLVVAKQYFVSFKMALAFAISMGLYLEIFRFLVDMYDLSTGTFWVPLTFLIVFPVIGGSVLFLKLKF